MNLITVTNQKFAHRALNLVASYYCQFDKRALIFYFGDFDTSIIHSFIQKYPKTVFLPVEMVCDHAHDSTFYFFKTYALKHGYDYFKDSIIYLDSAFEINGYPHSLMEKLKEKSRVFIAYPNDPEWNNWILTTQQCHKKLECVSLEYQNTPQYWAAIQAYQYTVENTEFINTFYNYMLDPEIAGPSNLLWYPEGKNSPCLVHRNDQSVLSDLIVKYGYDQKFEYPFTAEYCDIDTLFSGYSQHDYSNVKNHYNGIIRGRQNSNKYL